MRRILLIAGPAAAVVACASLLPAALAAPNSRTGHAAHAATTHAAASPVEHFRLVTTSIKNNANSNIIATGVFTAGGVDHPLSNHLDVFRLGNGTFKVHHPGGKSAYHVNPTTCLLTLGIHGKYTLGGGTGAYAGISGHGTYRAVGLAVFPRKTNGTCNEKGTPAGYEETILAHGPVTLPSG